MLLLAPLSALRCLPYRKHHNYLLHRKVALMLAAAFMNHHCRFRQQVEKACNPDNKRRARG